MMMNGIQTKMKVECPECGETHGLNYEISPSKLDYYDKLCPSCHDEAIREYEKKASDDINRLRR